MLENYIRDLVRQAVKEALADLQALAPSSSTTVEYLTLDQAAKRAGVSKSTLRNWIRAGTLKAVGRGRTIRVRPADLDAALQGGAADDDRAVVAQASSIIERLARQR